MMNLKNIFITTGLSILFGVYSIYNIIEYLKFMEKHRNKQINSLQDIINDTNKRYVDLNSKYIILQQKYDNLSVNYDKTNQEIVILNLKIIQLRNNNYEQENVNMDMDMSEIGQVSPVNTIIGSDDSSIICDELCDMNNSIPRIHMETMSSMHDSSIDPEFMESLYLDYTNDQLNSNNTNLSSSCNSEKNSVRSRSRSTSVTDINWTGLTKKFFFG